MILLCDNINSLSKVGTLSWVWSHPETLLSGVNGKLACSSRQQRHFCSPRPLVGKMAQLRTVWVAFKWKSHCGHFSCCYWFRFCVCCSVWLVASTVLWVIRTKQDTHWELRFLWNEQKKQGDPVAGGKKPSTALSRPVILSVFHSSQYVASCIVPLLCHIISIGLQYNMDTVALAKTVFAPWKHCYCWVKKITWVFTPGDCLYCQKITLTIFLAFERKALIHRWERNVLSVHLSLLEKKTKQ